MIQNQDAYNTKWVVGYSFDYLKNSLFYAFVFADFGPNPRRKVENRLKSPSNKLQKDF